FSSALITLGQLWGDMGIIYLLLGPTILGPNFLVVSSVNFLSVLWTPVNQAIYPALSAAHSTGDPREVSERLAAAFRLINLTVLPIGAALAAITPTALEIVYGASYVGEALTMSILSLSSVFVALPLVTLDQVFLISHPFRPVFQLIILFGLFVVLYGGICRRLRVFHHGDFAMLHDALPRRLRPYLKMVQRIIVSGAS